MACRCSACTPKDTRILRFLPPSRPPNFYVSLGQITTYIHFFYFFKIKHASSQKIIKNAYFVKYLCDLKVHREQPKTRFFTPKFFGAKSRFTYSIAVSCSCIFSGEKKYKKRTKNHVTCIPMG